MCTRFLKRRMENYQGDLTDIVRATANNTAAVPDWQFIPTDDDPINFSEDFGDPFTFMGDPLLQNTDPSGSGFFYDSSSIIKASIAEESENNIGTFCGDGGNNIVISNMNIGRKAVVDDHEMMIKRPPNIFSRMLQISPNNAKLPPVDSQPPLPVLGSPRALKGTPMLLSSSSKGCLVETPAMQISSPRNTGIKRRKSQAKKVVCIPAPAPANSRASGEVVPSDLWAWRKYGQKPIKGSPYPRGYYRCSSSKGCSARKQVERSRTDPNMLVITYTSEHNHPWPTQRNALAGSTRSQPSKTNSVSKNSLNSHPEKPKHDEKPEDTATPADVKEETMDQELDHNQLEIDDAEFDEGFPGGSYRPAMVGSNQPEDSFFAELGEIEADPLDLLFAEGFCGDDHGRENKELDPFGFYDWATAASTTTTTTSTTVSSTTSNGEANKDS